MIMVKYQIYQTYISNGTSPNAASWGSRGRPVGVDLHEKDMR
jgi:hypothetical protein